MSDITKCTGEGCELKDNCYRYTAPSSELWQSWSNFFDYIDEQGCQYYWKVKE